MTLISCNFFVRNGGFGTSVDILDSKKRQVFVQEYKSLKNPIEVNDSVKISIKSAWIEHVWRYKGEESAESEIENDSAYQLVIVCDDRSILTFNESWSIGDTKDSIFYNGYENSLITNLNNFTRQDTLKWKIVPKRFQKNSSSQNSIGSVVLVKVK